MQNQATIKTKDIAIGKAYRIIVGAISLYIIIGIVIGYMFFWQPQKEVTRYEAEISEALQLVRQRPSDINARVNLAFKYMKSKNYEQSRAEYNAALQIDPNNRVVLLNLAYFNLETKNYKEADSQLEKLVQSDPGFQVYALLGKSKYLQNQYEAAIQNLQMARDINPTDSDIYYYIGTSFRRLGQKEKAVEQLKSALQFDPNRQDAKDELKGLGVIWYKSEVKGH